MAGKKGSRVRKSDGEQLDVVTFRMPRRLKFGLDLLARLQGRSLTQAIEWALQSALINVKVGPPSPPISLWATACLAWEIQEPWERWMALFMTDPTLVPFEERHACRVIEQCKEWIFIRSREGEKRAAFEDQWAELLSASWDHLVRDSGDLFVLDYVSEGAPLLVALSLAAPDDAELPVPELIAKAHAVKFPSDPVGKTRAELRQLAADFAEVDRKQRRKTS